MANAKKQITAAPKDASEALEQIEQPKMNWKVLGLIGVALAVVWVIAGILQPSIGYVGLIVAAVLSVIALGFLIWIWRLTRKSADIAAILKGATDKEGRLAALEQLRARQSPGGKDALNAIAQAQLVAQEEPAEAIRILEGIEINKAPAMVQDDVRANLAMFYLMTGRARDARELANEIRLDRQPQAKAKAMYAAVVAESLARTGDAEEARKLLETYDPKDKEFGQVSGMLLRAQVYTYTATKKRGRAREAMDQLLEVDPNMVAAFMQKGTRPELSRLAKQVLASGGALPKQKMRVRTR
ncbi:MAG: tetratricopeptide repeat protein [Deltaproteobacteria bacterium]|nr:tetratricopeptide repeat protein [Deltaproteobacteria bacterium]NND27622.1 tetratricopeptide repeat protein [Myxococcales bacterium]MBT8465086.1 tetratricopeptide repeat protein [Deltaproteobacteria bacterium]MBT8481948.1 tetratricopeptide repeat protein [Deltaproteobacteria bacterium]NNK07385.1 tetratricopeptide repeat protein [Myxococcales bacterium]